MNITLQSGAIARTIQLTVQGLHGVTADKLTLTSPDGRWLIAVPRDQFPLEVEPGEPLTVSLTLLHARIIPADAPSPTILIPGKEVN